MQKDKIPLYLMPGMAASPRIFEYIKLPDDFELIKLSWMSPTKGESLSGYAKRMCQRIEHKNPVLLGVSFGGILVQEMAKHISCRKVIIVSSVKSNTEFTLSMKLAKKTGAHKLLPTSGLKVWRAWPCTCLAPQFSQKLPPIKLICLSVIQPISIGRLIKLYIGIRQ